MVIMSDITTLRERGKWQGFIGVAVAAGNTAGPFLGFACLVSQTDLS